MKPALAFVLSALLFGGLGYAAPSRGRFSGGGLSGWLSNGTTVSTDQAVSVTVPSPGVAIQTLTGAGTCLGTGGVGCLTYSTSGGAHIDSSVYLQAPNGFVASSGNFQARSASGGLSIGSAATPTLSVANGGTITRVGTLAGSALAIDSTGTALGTWFIAAPTITTACTSPTVTHGNTASFQIDVGGTCAGISAVVLGLPTTTNGWSCHGYNKTTSATAEIEQTADTTTSATMTNYTRTTGLALAFVDGADLVISCTGR